MRWMRAVLAVLLSAAMVFGQAPQKRRGKSESIKVHGHWVLEIENPDGSVAARKTFENSPQGSGAVELGSRSMAPGW